LHARQGKSAPFERSRREKEARKGSVFTVTKIGYTPYLEARLTQRATRLTNRLVKKKVRKGRNEERWSAPSETWVERDIETKLIAKDKINFKIRKRGKSKRAVSTGSMTAPAGRGALENSEPARQNQESATRRGSGHVAGSIIKKRTCLQQGY